MTLQIQINIQADEDGAFTDTEKAVLTALTGEAKGLTFQERPERAYVKPTGTDEPSYTDAPAEGFTPASAGRVDGLADHIVKSAEETSRLQEQIIEAHEAGHTTEPEKPKRKRRTKAEIEADEKAAEEAQSLAAAEGQSTGAAVLENLGEPDIQDDPTADEDTDAAPRMANETAAAQREPEVGDPAPAEEPKLEATSEPTPADALARASDLVETDAGKDLVAKALKEIGVGRVSLIASNEDAAKFLEIVGK